MTTRTLATALTEMRAEADARGMLTLDADVLLALLDCVEEAEAALEGRVGGLIDALAALEAHVGGTP